MPKYVIERDIPGIGSMPSVELRDSLWKTCDVLEALGPSIQWQYSHVTADKIYCIYIAPDEQLIREHARQAGMPTGRISKIMATIDPTTAE